MFKSIGYYSLAVLLVFISVNAADATHLRAGEITVLRPSCNSYTLTIVLHVYTKNSSTVKFGGGTLTFGDGSTPVTTTQVSSPPTIPSDEDGGVGVVTYPVQHTFPGPGTYLITYYEQNRNQDILNMTNSVLVPFFIQTVIVIDPLLGCDNSPQLLVPPIDEGCTGKTWMHNPGAYDIDGDSLSYALFVPKQAKDVDVPGYQDPNAEGFYTAASIPYGKANGLGTGPPTFSINPVTGTITWDAPGEPGEYNIAFRVFSWRKIKDIQGNNRWISLGYVERDMQIIIENCTNRPPVMLPLADTCVLAGTIFNRDIVATDPDGSSTGGTGKGDSVKIEAYSQVFALLHTAGYNPSPAIISPGSAIPDSPVWQPTFTSNTPATITFSWQPSCQDIKEQPYSVVFKASDNGRPELVTFTTWNIRVVAPPPVWNSITLNPGNRSAALVWKSYLSNPGVPTTAVMQIWRRVDSNPFTPAVCVTGMPDGLGYTMIATVPITATTYTDPTLAAGAKYCYRLVAAFPPPNGGESYVSSEVCVGPIIIDAPVITNVTVDVTDPAAGQITVKWRSPFQADPVQFPKPYTFKVYRADGAKGKVSQPVTPGQLSDSVFVDTGINTRDKSYHYRIDAYASNSAFVDSAAAASSVQLDLKSGSTTIQLDWSATVPWSNSTLEYPRHLIYRSANNPTTIAQMTLIDSVDVTKQLFTYTDASSLDNSTNYCYAVMTRGSYGNPNIKTPLDNFSQITCVTLNDTVPPCKPVIAITATNCDENFCPADGYAGGGQYQNVLSWSVPANSNCKVDIQGYYVYSALSMGQAYTKISGLVTDTFYVDNKLTTYARCYKVTVVDRAGKESDPSASVCFDNCPNYQLPNFFSPNGDKCNETFSAYSKRNDNEGAPNCPSMTVDQFNALGPMCARYVVSVDFTVYNRWGREVYHYSGSSGNPGEGPGVFIDWNGKDNNGKDVDGGTYYYIANVVFDVVDPKKRNRTIKGWVLLAR